MVTRRTLLASAAVSPLLTVPSIRAQESTSAATGASKATFVLVHGAWAGAWIWKKVIPLLRAAGHEVYAGTNTGMGDRVHLADPAIDLDTYVTDFVNLLEFEELTDVTLVGWSYGGMTITGVAERAPERLAQLIYLDAFVPADGDSAAELFGLPPEALEGDTFPLIPGLAEAMTKDPADLAWLQSKFVPQPTLTFTQPITVGNPAAAALPRAFVFCTETPLEPFASTATTLKSDSAWDYRELPDNHFCAVNDPQATAEALLSLV